MSSHTLLSSEIFSLEHTVQGIARPPQSAYSLIPISVQGQVGSCQSTCHSGEDSDLSHHKRFSQLRGLYSQNGLLSGHPPSEPSPAPWATMGDGLRGTIKALCLEDLMRNPRHHRNQVRANLHETLTMEARNSQCSITELSTLLAFDLHCGIPGKVRRIVFGHDHAAALDHAFLYVHLGIHLFCLSTRVQCIMEAAQAARVGKLVTVLGPHKGLAGCVNTLNPPPSPACPCHNPRPCPPSCRLPFAPAPHCSMPVVLRGLQPRTVPPGV